MNMSQFSPENDWPLDLEGIEVTPILDDSSPQMIGHPEGGYGAVALGEPDTSPFGVWDSGPQQPPSFSRGIPQSMGPGPSSLEASSSNLSSESLDDRVGSFHLGAERNIPMASTELSNRVGEKEKFQCPNDQGIFGQPPHGNFGYTRQQFPSNDFRQSSTDASYQEEFQHLQLSQTKLRRNVSAGEFHSERDFAASHSSRVTNEATLLNQAFATKIDIKSSTSDSSSAVTQNFGIDNTSFIGQHEGGNLGVHQAFQIRFPNQQFDSHQFEQHQCLETSGNFYSMSTDNFGSENLELFSDRSIKSGPYELGSTTEQLQDFSCESLETFSENFTPTPACELLTSPRTSRFGAAYNYFSSEMSSSSSSTSESEVFPSEVTTKRKDKLRSRLPKADYQNMSSEEMKVRQRELNKIAAREYRKRTKDLLKSKREYEEEQQRQQQMKEKIACFEAKITAMEDSFKKLSTA